MENLENTKEKHLALTMMRMLGEELGEFQVTESGVILIETGKPDLNKLVLKALNL